MSIVTRGYGSISDGAIVTQGYADTLFAIGVEFTVDIALSVIGSSELAVDMVLKSTELITFRIDIGISKDGQVLSPDEFEWDTLILRDNLWTSIER